MASPCSHDQFDAQIPSVLDMVFQAASDDELSLFKELVTIIDMGRGCPKEAIEELRVEDVGKLEGFSALHIAATRGSLKVCRYLVEELLLDVDLVDKEGRTPLLFATYHNGGTAEYLLDHGANQDKVDHDGVSLLHYAAELGNCEMVELLLAKGAYVDPVAARGTPLHIAAGEGHYGAMKILLDHNADYNKMVNGVTPLMAATDANSTKCIKLLVKVQEEPMLKREIVTSELISLGSISLKKKDYVVAAKLYSQDYEGASERFLDGLKLDPVDTDIEDALREAMKSLKTFQSMKAK